MKMAFLTVAKHDRRFVFWSLVGTILGIAASSPQFDFGYIFGSLLLMFFGFYYGGEITSIVFESILYKDRNDNRWFFYVSCFGTLFFLSWLLGQMLTGNIYGWSAGETHFKVFAVTFTPTMAGVRSALGKKKDEEPDP